MHLSDQNLKFYEESVSEVSREGVQILEERDPNQEGSKDKMKLLAAAQAVAW